MSMGRDDLSPGQKTLRSLGMTVILGTALLTAGLAVTYVSSDDGSTWSRLALATSMAAASVACFGILVDAFDFWVRGGRMTPFSRKMTRSLVFVAMLVALGLSLLAAGPALLLTLTPALMIYLFGVVRQRPAPIRRPPDLSSGHPSSAPRQKRGGKKRK
jgi:O-antigen/teichoic acid export membrane protein